MTKHYQWNIYEAWLNQIDGIGRQKMKRFAQMGTEWRAFFKNDSESLHNIVERAYKSTPANIRAMGKLTIEKDYAAILEARKVIHPEKLYEEMLRKGIRYVNRNEDVFPNRLREIPDAPYALYVKGQPFRAVRMNGEDDRAVHRAEDRLVEGADHRAEDRRGEGADHRAEDWCTGGAGIRKKAVVAVIGARMCSEYGKYMAQKLGSAAAELEMEVVSGLASGIDGIAQNAARLSGGEVTAVLGSGVDVCYPAENRSVYEGILEHGRIISEYPPGTRPLGQNFPPRNRIISGLADAVVVVEAKKRSGTLITVDMALEQGRDVYAVPGRVSDAMSYGCNRLIAQGAEAVVDVVETLLQIRDRGGKCTSEAAPKLAEAAPKQAETDLTETVLTEADLIETDQAEAERRGAMRSGIEYTEAKRLQITKKEAPQTDIRSMILRQMEVHARSVQELYEALHGQTGISLADLQNRLICMELAGEVSEEGGKYKKVCFKMPYRLDGEKGKSL